MKLRQLTFLILALISPSVAHALEGAVLDAETDLPLSGVTITAAGTGHITVTDSVGAFSIPTSLGTLLTFSRIGYAHHAQIFDPQRKSVVIHLRLRPIPMEQMDVIGQTDSVDDITRRPAFATVIDRESFSHHVTSLPEILDRSAGLQVQSLGGLGAFSTISVRGSSSEQIEVYLDDILLNAAVGGGVNLSNLPLANISRIEVTRGAGQDGNGLGGTVHIITRDSDSTRRSVSASWGSFDTRGFSAVASGAANGARYLLIGDYSSSDNNFGFLDNNGTEYNLEDDQYSDRRNNDLNSGSLLGKTTVDLRESRTLSLSQTLFWKRQGIPGISNNQTTRTRFDTFRSMTQLSLEDRGLADRVAAKGAIYFTHLGESFLDSLGEIGTGRQDNSYRTRTYGIRTQTKWVASRNHLLTLHTDIRRETYDPKANIQLITPLFASRRWTLQAGGEADLSFLNGRLTWTASANLRQQRSRFIGRNPFAFSPQAPDSLTIRTLTALRTGFRADLFRTLMLKANVARSQRAPSFFELFGDRGSVVGNTSLIPEVGITWDIGCRIGSSKQWLEAVYFNQRYDNLIQFVQTSQATSRPVNVGKAVVNGLELSALKIFGRFSLSSNYTLQNSENRSIVPHLTGNALPGRPRHKANARADIGIGRFSASYDYAFEDGNFLDQANRRKLDSRHIHTASLRVKVRKTIQLGLDAKNLGNARVMDVWGYPLPGRALFVSLRENW